MVDKSLEGLVLVIVGIGGIALLLVAWLQPLIFSERILRATLGAASLLPLIIRVVVPRYIKSRSQ